MDLPAQDPEEVNSLEAPATADVAGGGSDTPPEGGVNPDGKGLNNKPADTKPKKKPGGTLLQRLVSHVNIYLLVFVFIMVLAGIGVFVSLQNAKKETEEPTLTTQDLTQEALEQINESEVKVGDPKQTLSIESNAIFSGKVLVRDSLDVAGSIKIGGSVNLPGLTVSGTSSFDQIQANKLSVNGDVGVNGTLSVQANLSVAGGATFGGQVSAPRLVVQDLQLSGNLTFTRHIDAGGPTPGVSKGAALGGGGTASVGGTDTAGTVSISTGGGPGAGCFATISFAASFSGTPHVVVTPVGSAAGGLNWYINRSSSNFSICTASAPPAGANFAFDYVVID
jgi:cytoskeletal protein CcmA (bactofilin family)